MVKTKGQTLNMLRFIKSAINDPYAMAVLYYEIRNQLAKHNFNLKNVEFIILSNKYFDQEVRIDVRQRYYNRLYSLSLLLSVRALMIDKSWIWQCRNSYLILDASKEYTYRWVVKFSSLLYDCLGDKDFRQIFALFKKTCTEESFTKDEISSFIESTVSPEPRNLTKYYISEARHETVTEDVIGNNTFVLSDMETYTVTKNIEYIGDSAFAFCNNLNSIKIQGEKVKFGKFPIIECGNLKQITVPEGSEMYYKEQLPYYADIITSNYNDA